MITPRRLALIRYGLMALVLIALSYWSWQHYHRRPDRPGHAPPDKRGVADWIHDLKDQDYTVKRRAVAALISIGAPAAPRLVMALKDRPNSAAELALVRMGPEAVPALSAALQNKQLGEQSARVLGLMGGRAAEATPALIALLKDDRAEVSLRVAAALALGFIGTPSGDIVSALREALTRDKSEVRFAAASALHWIGPPAAKAKPALLKALNDDDDKTAAAACQALARLGDPGAAAPLLTALRSKGDIVANDAVQALWQMGPLAKGIVSDLVTLLDKPGNESQRARLLLSVLGPAAVPKLREALHAKEARKRQAAAEVLAIIGPAARIAVPDLAAAVKDMVPAVRMAAAVALTRIDPTRARDAGAVPLLADALDHPSAALALAKIGREANAATPALIAALKRADPAVRFAAGHALACIGPPAAPDLIDALKDSKTKTACLAAAALGSVLPPPKQAVSALRLALKRQDVRACAGAALVSIDATTADEVVPLLIADMTDPDRRDTVLAALRVIGPRAKEAIPALLRLPREYGEKVAPAVKQTLVSIGPAVVPHVAELLADPDARFRRFALTVLVELGPVVEEALPSLIGVLEDEEDDLRALSAQSLQTLGAKAGAAVPALIVNLHAPQGLVRATAAAALGHIGPGAKQARQTLVECLVDVDAGVRLFAALSLGRIDASYVKAVPDLRDALHDADPLVRVAALDSLSRIDPAAGKDALSILRDVAGKPHAPNARFRALRGLIQLAPEQAKTALSWLPVFMYDLYNPQLRLQAAALAIDIDAKQTARAVLAVLPELHSPEPGVRGRTAIELGKLGGKAREAVPSLLPLLHDDVPAVRRAAIRALQAIDLERANKLGIGGDSSVKPRRSPC